MPSTLSTTISKIVIVPNDTNSTLVDEYYQLVNIAILGTINKNAKAIKRGTTIRSFLIDS